LPLASFSGSLKVALQIVSHSICEIIVRILVLDRVLPQRLLLKTAGNMRIGAYEAALVIDVHVVVVRHSGATDGGIDLPSMMLLSAVLLLVLRLDVGGAYAANCRQRHDQQRLES
jgi:3-dehydroquinate synthase class II